MARYLLEWVDRWRQHEYTAEATLEKVAEMLRNMQVAACVWTGHGKKFIRFSP